MDEMTAILKRIRKRFKNGKLKIEDIDRALAQAQGQIQAQPQAQAQKQAQRSSTGSKQSLLYLHAPSTNPHSAVVGISIYEDGADSDGLDENGDFRYRSIKEALDDGWRIIKFPEASLAMNEQGNYGLGYEFVLERWR
ncbi:MAG: hypothetical protein OXD39_15765 [Gemmatimonadetes bacterium]|nr:hypothetical protein [Gemmatimonadota bacterium]